IARTAHLSNAVAVRKCGSRFSQIERAVRIAQRFSLLVPDAHHLCGLLLDGHSREQIRDAILCGERAIVVRLDEKLGCQEKADAVVRVKTEMGYGRGWYLGLETMSRSDQITCSARSCHLPQQPLLRRRAMRHLRHQPARAQHQNSG